MTEEGKATFDMATQCQIFDEMLGNYRVHDHDHISGKYRGPAHNNCNLKLRIYPYKIKALVVFYN